MDKKMELPRILIFFSTLLYSTSTISMAADILRGNQVWEENQTLVSLNQRFELGFFSPGSSKNTYLGIWYKNLPRTFVWVANRNHPIVGPIGRLSLTSDGFSLLNNNSVVVWSVNASTALTSPVLQLLNNSNLVLSDENKVGSDENYIWQSFDCITDTLLPGMELGWDLRKGLHRNLISWSSDNDPSDGEFTFGLESTETPQLVLMKGTEKQSRWGPWDGVRFSGNDELNISPFFSSFFNSSDEKVFYTYKAVYDNSLLRAVVTQQGTVQYYTWNENMNSWISVLTLQNDGCNEYRICGPHGSCHHASAYVVCECLKGFEPKSAEDWDRFIRSAGCERKWELNCTNGDAFVKYKGLKLPDHSYLASNGSLSLEECEAECLRNCSCMAYTRLNIHGNGGNCVMWSGDLFDISEFADGSEDFYIRMARQELKSIADAKKRKRVRVAVITVLSTVAGLLLIGVIGWYLFCRRKTTRPNGIIHTPYEEHKPETTEEELELPLFHLDDISQATDEFAFRNKIGEGGFGPVYRGILPSGQEIAVKRLSQNSTQGIQELKNEVVVIAKLQHRNLVKLLGCCIQGEERILVYEYLPNKSLNSILFDQSKKRLCTWKKRFDIIMGIARGLLYLHQDSRLRIIHRDLKASNILLDIEMNPKISDFGLARIFGEEQTQERTRRVMGTYGYMSPEYAMSGHFSVKSDVFSFGVLVLEIVSGKKNWGFYHTDHDFNLLGHVWKLWNEGKPLEVMDAQMVGSFSVNEVIRCVKVGLLCVQLHVEDRPTMSLVLSMLGNESSMIPEPKEPGFVTEVSFFRTDTSSSGKNPHTADNMTVTILDGR